MEVKGLQAEIDGISVMLYQNREQEALEKFGDIFKKMRQMTETLLCVQNHKEQEMLAFISRIYQNLNQAYQHKDMLGMADCLQEYAALAMELNQSKC